MLSLQSDTKSENYPLWVNDKVAISAGSSQWDDQDLVNIGIAVVLGCTLFGIVIGLAVWGWPN